MICRHAPGDPNCSSNGGGYAAEAAYATQREYEKKLKELEAGSPDAGNYTVERVEFVLEHLVMMVRYPNCAKCAYEGNKVMVFLNTTPLDALKWKRIDPHFRDPKLANKTGQAPAPAARFPASDEGWADAVDYARRKSKHKAARDDGDIGLYAPGTR